MCVVLNVQDLVKEQKEIEDAADSFTCWLVKQKISMLRHVLLLQRNFLAKHN